MVVRLLYRRGTDSFYQSNDNYDNNSEICLSIGMAVPWGLLR